MQQFELCSKNILLNARSNSLNKKRQVRVKIEGGVYTPKRENPTASVCSSEDRKNVLPCQSPNVTNERTPIEVIKEASLRPATPQQQQFTFNKCYKNNAQVPAVGVVRSPESCNLVAQNNQSLNMTTASTEVPPLQHCSQATPLVIQTHPRPQENFTPQTPQEDVQMHNSWHSYNSNNVDQQQQPQYQQPSHNSCSANAQNNHCCANCSHDFRNTTFNFVGNCYSCATFKISVPFSYNSVRNCASVNQFDCNNYSWDSFPTESQYSYANGCECPHR